MNGCDRLEKNDCHASVNSGSPSAMRKTSMMAIDTGQRQRPSAMRVGI